MFRPLLCAAAVGLVGCDSLIGLGAEPTLRTEEPTANCVDPPKDLVDQGTKWARIASNSNVVRSCVFAAMHGTTSTLLGVEVPPYQYCYGDPDDREPNELRYDSVLELLRSNRYLAIPCGSPPTLRLSPHEVNEIASLYPLPIEPALLREFSGLLWRVSMRERGYVADPCPSSMPELVQQCVSGSMSTACSSTSCRANALALPRDLDPTGSAPLDDCDCVEDPAAFGDPVLTFYSPTTGHSDLMRLNEDSSLVTRPAIRAATGRQVVALPFGLRVWFDPNTGATTRVRVGSFGADAETLLLGSLGGSFSHVVALPDEHVVAYSSSSSTGAVFSVDESGQTRVSSPSFPVGARFVVASSYDRLVFVRADGTGESGRLSASGEYESSRSLTELGTGWTEVASAGDEHVVFYRRDDGETVVTRLLPDGRLDHLRTLPLEPGWDRIAPTFDGRFVFYAQSGEVVVRRMRPDGTLAQLNSQTITVQAPQLVINK